MPTPRSLAQDRTRALALAAFGGAAALGTAGAVAWAGVGEDEPIDHRVRAWLRDRQHPHVHRASTLVGHLGSTPAALAAAGAGAMAVARRHGRAPALPLVVCVGAALASHALVKSLVQRPRPSRRRRMRTSSFPSGHSTRAAAVAALTGYVALRDDLAPRRAVLPLGVAIPAAVGASRVYGDRHWATDVGGGWGLGVAIAALGALWYERARAAARQ